MDRFGNETSESESDSDSVHRKESINSNVRRMNQPVGSHLDLTTTDGFIDENIDLTVFEAAREGSEEKIRRQVIFSCGVKDSYVLASLKVGFHTTDFIAIAHAKSSGAFC